MAGKKPAKLATKGGAPSRAFPIKLCFKCGKQITAAKDYLPLLVIDKSEHFRRQQDCHRACIKI